MQVTRYPVETVTTAPSGARSSVPPMFGGGQVRLATHMEIRCSACGLAKRLGRRRQNQLRAAAQHGRLAGLDISRLPF